MPEKLQDFLAFGVLSRHTVISIGRWTTGLVSRRPEQRALPCRCIRECRGARFPPRPMLASEQTRNCHDRTTTTRHLVVSIASRDVAPARPHRGGSAGGGRKHDDRTGAKHAWNVASAFPAAAKQLEAGWILPRGGGDAPWPRDLCRGPDGPRRHHTTSPAPDNSPAQAPQAWENVRALLPPPAQALGPP